MNKKSRKILSVFLSVLMLISLIPIESVTVFADVSGDFEYEVLSEDEKTCVITNYYGNESNLDIPSELGGYTVTSIGDRAFLFCTSLEGVTIPDSVTSIGNRAFSGCTSLANVEICEGVTSIGDAAFLGCTSLTNIDVSEGNTVYSSKNGVMFDKAQKELLLYPAGKPDVSYDIPEGVTSIGEEAFYYCTSLKSVTIPNSVTDIGYYAFGGCTSLANVEVCEGVKSIGEGAFYGCTSLESVIIPGSVTSIGEQAFYGCTLLTNVEICEGVTSIGNEVFLFCTSLESVTIPDSVTDIGYDAFAGCTSLTDIDVSEGNTVYSSKNGVVFDKPQKELLLYPAGKPDVSYDIPEGVTSIGEEAFDRCTSLESITIPGSVTSIGNSAFSGCTSLANVEICEGVTSIGDWAFENCTSLESITIPNSVTSIGRFALSGCRSATFYNDGTGLSFNWSYLPKKVNVIIFNDTKPGSVTSIENGAFQDCTSLTNLEICEGVTSIGDWAFSGCTSLESVTIPGSVTSIGNSAFSGCTSLANVKIPEGVTSIGYWAFENCTSLESVTVPGSVTSIGNDAFYDCTSLTNIDVSEGNTVYSSKNGVVFDKAQKELLLYPAGKPDVSYDIPEGVTSIGGGAFAGCTSLANVEICEGVTSVGDGAFAGCTSLANVEICEGVTSIGEEAFFGCTSLESVTIPGSVTDIGSNAFEDCTSLANVEICEGVTSVGYWAFIGCTSLESLTIPNSVTSIGSLAVNNENFKIYGYRGSYAETYAKEESYKFIPLDSVVQYSKSQIRFHGIGADGSKANYKGAFDVRTVAKISQQDFIKSFGIEETAVQKIGDIGFVYASAANVDEFDIETAKAVAEGRITDENYIKKPVKYIQHAGDGADYIFTCLISDIPDADKEQSVYALGYVYCNGVYYYFDDVAMTEFNTLYSAYMPKD